MIKVNITNLYGMFAQSTVMISQNEVARISRQLGFNELSIYNYPVSSDSEGQLSARLDGINASLQMNDIVIFQLPTWNGLEFERAFLDKLRAYGCKVIFFIQDVPPLMFKSNYSDWMQPHIEFYDQADLLILPSRNMEKRLRAEGLQNSNVIYQNLWDHVTTFEPQDPEFKRELTFLGSQNRFPFTQQWNYETKLNLFAHVDNEDANLNINYRGFYPGDELLKQLNSGFGLCWSENTEQQDEREYSKLNASYKLSTYLAAGLPVIANQGIATEEFIKKHHLGFIAKDLVEVNNIVQTISEDEYRDLTNSVKGVSFLVRNGYMTKKVLIDAVQTVMLSD